MDQVAAQHRQLEAGRWAEMSFALQMANIGSEVSRALRWKEKMKTERSQKAFYRALELVDFSIEDARHRMGQTGRLRELCRCREELCDYFAGDNDFHTDPARLMRYYDQFAQVTRKNEI